MPPIEENQNTAPDMPVGPETPPSSAVPEVVVSDTADVASQGPTDAPPVPTTPPVDPLLTGAVHPLEISENPSKGLAPEGPQVGSLPSDSPHPEVLQSAPIVVKRNDVREYLAMALEKISGKKAKKLAKIMEVLEEKGTITNDEVEKLIHCSDATATRYLSALEKDGKIVQSGKIGRSVTYLKA